MYLPIVFGILISLLVGLLLYYLFVPTTNKTFNPKNKSEREKNKLLNITTLIGTEIYATLPSSLVDKQKDNENHEIKDLLIKSGNPWGFTEYEFKFFKIVTAFIGFIIGWILLGLFSISYNMPWFIFPTIFTILGYFFPSFYYKKVANDRKFAYLKELPNALDLIVISLSVGEPILQALRQATKNMSDGILKSEFQRIINSVDTGRSLHSALNDFADRAPDDQILTFTRAIQEENELNVSMIETMESQARESRSRLFRLLNEKASQLSLRVNLITIPTVMISLIVLLGFPFVMSVVNF